MRVPATLPELTAATAALLRDAGPLSEREIVDALQGQGLDLGADPDHTVKDVLADEDLPLVIQLHDGSHCRSSSTTRRTVVSSMAPP